MPTITQIGTPLIADTGGVYVTATDKQLGLDIRVFQSVISRSVATPPNAPLDGARYIIAAGATSTWTGGSGRLALYTGGSWRYYRPVEGWRTWIEDENRYLVFNGLTWDVVGNTLDTRTSDPASPALGQMWLRTDLI